MWLFKKHRQQELAPLTQAAKDKIAEKIALAGILLQTKFSNSMNQLFNSMTTIKIKLLLIFFCLCVGGYSVYLIGSAITKDEKKQVVFKIGTIKVSRHIGKTGDKLIISDNNIDDKTFKRISQFKNYMDSLKQERSLIYDSILRARPMLMDSFLELEEIYYLQKQK